MSGAQVFSATDGRLRVTVGGIKNNPERAADMCQAIRRIPGVRSAGAEVSAPRRTPPSYSTLLAYTGRQIFRSLANAAREAALKRAFQALT